MYNCITAVIAFAFLNGVITEMPRLGESKADGAHEVAMGGRRGRHVVRHSSSGSGGSAEEWDVVVIVVVTRPEIGSGSCRQE